MKVLIKNGTIVNASGEMQGDILTGDGLIQQIAKEINAERVKPDRVIDARGWLVLPGGVDPHVHMHLPTGAGHSSDDFFNGSKAALAGGTTTLIDFVTPKRGQSLTEALAIRKTEAAFCLTDYSFHVSPVEWRDTTAEEMISVIKKGMTSFKVYMAYKDAIGIDVPVMEQVMQTAASNKALVTVHAETGEEVDRLRRQLAESGQTSPAAHPKSRPPHTESDAVKTAIETAKKTGCRLYIVHVSAADSVKHIRKAQQQGQEVFGEACTHHLLLDEDLYDRAFEEAAPYVLSPPLRKAADREALMEGLQDGTLQVVATDHCPFFMHQKKQGLEDFRKIANGAGSVEHRLPLLYTNGVQKGLLGNRDFVNLCATRPAQIFGLYPRKGVIAEGSDADLVIWDPRKTDVISASTHLQRSDFNIYEGMETTGKAVVVIKGGRIAFQDDCFHEIPPGELLQRSCP